MAVDIPAAIKFIKKSMGAKHSQADPQILNILSKYGVELPADLDANFLTHREIENIYGEIKMYQYKKEQQDQQEDPNGTWTDPAGGVHRNDEGDPAKMYESKIMKILESSGHHTYELHYSDGVRGVLKGNSWKDLIEKISMKPVNEWSLFNNAQGFHSIDQDEYLLKWWGRGSYWDNMSKKYPELMKKKYTGYQQTKDFIRVGKDDSSDDRIGDDPSSQQYYDRSIKRESKNMKNKTALNETSHEIDTTRNFMRYEDSDVVADIKKIFEKSDYSEFTLVNIQSNGDKFFNIEISYELDDEETENLEFSRATLVQKIHKLRSKLFADIASEIPVVNSNIGAISIGKATNIAKFVIVLLTSATNNREWSTGKKKEIVKESFQPTKKTVSLVEGNLYHYEKENKSLVLEYVGKITGGRRFIVLDKNAKIPEKFSIRESEIETVIKTKQSLDESLNRLLEFSLPPAGRPRDTYAGGDLPFGQLKLLVGKFAEWCKLVTRYESENHKAADELAVKYLVPYNLVRAEPGDEDSGYSFYDVAECSIKNPSFRNAIEKLAEKYIY